MEKKKQKLQLKKETLISLQENQMKALLGAEDMTTQSGAVCDNDVEVDLKPQAAARAAADSCCRRSC